MMSAAPLMSANVPGGLPSHDAPNVTGLAEAGDTKLHSTNG
jgi:hypothetical protein